MHAGKLSLQQCSCSGHEITPQNSVILSTVRVSKDTRETQDTSLAGTATVLCVLMVHTIECVSEVLMQQVCFKMLSDLQLRPKISCRGYSVSSMKPSDAKTMGQSGKLGSQITKFC